MEFNSPREYSLRLWLAVPPERAIEHILKLVKMPAVISPNKEAESWGNLGRRLRILVGEVNQLRA